MVIAYPVPPRTSFTCIHATQNFTVFAILWSDCIWGYQNVGVIWYHTKLDSFSVQCLGRRDYDSLLFHIFELVIKTAWCRPAFNPMHLALANFVGYGENWKVEIQRVKLMQFLNKLQWYPKPATKMYRVVGLSTTAHWFMKIMTATS